MNPNLLKLGQNQLSMKYNVKNDTTFGQRHGLEQMFNSFKPTMNLKGNLYFHVYYIKYRSKHEFYGI